MSLTTKGSAAKAFSVATLKLAAIALNNVVRKNFERNHGCLFFKRVPNQGEGKLSADAD